MFCPGTSFDKDGQVLVTGGTTPRSFSIFNPRVKPKENPAGEWKPPKGKFELGRGYAGQTYVADGTTFMIGGTWGSAGRLDKNSKDGEVYDPDTDKWHLLSAVTGDSIKMDKSVACEDEKDKPFLPNPDCEKVEWQQHHPWLFAWKGNSIFHAGPSKKMHWFYTTLPNGKTEEAGSRANDNDAVCAVTSMYGRGSRTHPHRRRCSQLSLQGYRKKFRWPGDEKRQVPMPSKSNSEIPAKSSRPRS